MSRHFSILLSPSVHFLLTALCVLAIATPSTADPVPNPVVTASARPFNATFTAENLFDTGTAEFASQSQGAVSAPFTTEPTDGTWVELDFGAPVRLSQFVMVGRANNVDLIGTSRLIISADPTFDASDTIFSFDSSSANSAGPIQNLTPVTGQYARWEVLTRTGSGLNLG